MAPPTTEISSAIRILVADQHPVIRIGVENLLQTEAGIKVVGQAGNSDQAIAGIQDLCPDILLLALNLPGLEVMREVMGNSPETTTILLVNVISRDEILKAIELNARGLVIKEELIGSLLPAIRAISAGKYWIGNHRAVNFAAALATAAPPKTASVKTIALTPRELEVVQSVLKGSSNRDIAQEFHLSEETVKRHLSNIFDKTGVTTRLELALFAIEHQLVASHP
jgi:DNA-binding NarL/FixJ family response regulator